MEQEMAVHALNRCRVYAFLEQFYNGVPTENFVEKLFNEGFIKNLEDLTKLAGGELREGAELLEYFIKLSSSKNLAQLTEELAVEYTRLFRGLKPRYSPPPPYESIYRGEDRVMGESTLSVMRSYLDAGVALDKEYGGPPDYIGTELKFMALTSYREAENWREGAAESIEEAKRLLKVQERFLKEHMHNWIPKFCDVMLEEAESDFYRAVAKFTRGFIGVEREQLERQKKLGGIQEV